VHLAVDVVILRGEMREVPVARLQCRDGVGVIRKLLKQLVRDVGHAAIPSCSLTFPE